MYACTVLQSMCPPCKDISCLELEVKAGLSFQNSVAVQGHSYAGPASAECTALADIPAVQSGASLRSPIMLHTCFEHLRAWQTCRGVGHCISREPQSAGETERLGSHQICSCSFMNFHLEDTIDMYETNLQRATDQTAELMGHNNPKPTAKYRQRVPAKSHRS